MTLSTTSNERKNRCDDRDRSILTYSNLGCVFLQQFKIKALCYLLVHLLVSSGAQRQVAGSSGQSLQRCESNSQFSLLQSDENQRIPKTQLELSDWLRPKGKRFTCIHTLITITLLPLHLLSPQATWSLFKLVALPLTDVCRSKTAAFAKPETGHASTGRSVIPSWPAHLCHRQGRQTTPGVLRRVRQ